MEAAVLPRGLGRRAQRTCFSYIAVHASPFRCEAALGFVLLFQPPDPRLR